MLYSDNWFCLFVLGLLGFFVYFFLKFLNFQKRIFITGTIWEKTFNCDRITLFIYVFFQKKIGGGGIFIVFVDFNLFCFLCQWVLIIV